MFNSFPVSWLIAIGTALFTIAIVARARARHKVRDDRQRIGERMRKFERKKSLEPAEVEAFVDEILHSQNLDPSSNPRLPEQLGGVTALQRETPKDNDVDAVIEEILEHREPSIPGRTVSPQLTDVEPLRHASPDYGDAIARECLPLPAGTKIRAARNIGSVKEGTFGIITGTTKIPYFGSRYQCTFANNIKVRAPPKRIQAFDHEYDLEQLEQPDFAAVLSRQMMLKAQRLFLRQGQQALAKPIINVAVNRQRMSA